MFKNGDTPDHSWYRFNLHEVLSWIHKNLVNVGTYNSIW